MRVSADHQNQQQGEGLMGTGLEKARDKCWLSVQGQRRAGPGERKEIKKISTTALSDEGYG